VDADGNVEFLRDCPIRFHTGVVGHDPGVLIGDFAQDLKFACCVHAAQRRRRRRASVAELKDQSANDATRVGFGPACDPLRGSTHHTDDVVPLGNRQRRAD
jgi:hypothetical protein